MNIFNLPLLYSVYVYLLLTYLRMFYLQVNVHIRKEKNGPLLT